MLEWLRCLILGVLQVYLASAPGARLETVPPGLLREIAKFAVEVSLVVVVCCFH